MARLLRGFLCIFHFVSFFLPFSCPLRHYLFFAEFFFSARASSDVTSEVMG